MMIPRHDVDPDFPEYWEDEHAPTGAAFAYGFLAAIFWLLVIAAFVLL